ncbi:MAG: hypothetical protein E7I83_08365 [Veillonella sp.]|nr:hypothetical protein [Veillonella sp.]
MLDDGGSGHAGGGGGDRSSLFPKPLSADEVAARTKAVVANVEPSTATDIPDAVDVPSKGSENTSNVSGVLVQERALVMDRVKAKALVRTRALVMVMVELMSLLINKAFIML